MDSGNNRRLECPLTYEIQSSSTTHFDSIVVLSGTLGVNGSYKVALKDTFEAIQDIYTLTILVTGYVESLYTSP